MDDVKDPGEGKNIPAPKPSSAKKKDMLQKNATRFKSVDSNAKNVSCNVAVILR